MPSISTSLRAAAVVVVVAAGANAGIAAASAQTTRKPAKVSQVSAKPEKKHARANKKARGVQQAHSAKRSVKRTVKEPARKKRPTKPTRPTTTTPTSTTPTSTTPTTTTPTSPAPTTTTPTSTTPTTTTPTTTGSPQPTGVPGAWNLVLDSDFNGPSLNTSVWRTGWFNSTGTSGPINSSETACYTPSNVSFPGDGTMHLNVTHTASTCSGVNEPWTGGVVTTNPDDGRPSGGFQYTYGLVEARVYLPADGTGIANWPAVWSDGQSWPNDGENDVLESINNQVCSTFHDPLGAPHVCLATGAITPGWHTFAADWEPGSVTYYYDGTDVGTVTSGITSSPMYLILDNTVDATDFSDNTADSMQVQYVRVWQH
jgi:hypothetical protein